MFQDFQQFLRWYQARNNQLLATLIDKQGLPDGRLKEAIRYSLLSGGKRLRPALVYASAAASGETNSGETNEASDHFACAVEAIHSYSLIHDDLPAMDDDKLRRGQATCHIAFGEAHAILAGDALQSLAFDWVLAAPGLPVQSIVEASKVLIAGASGMVIGQALDIEALNGVISVEALESMHRNKTGALIEASLIMGAISAGASNGQIQALSSYGRAIGLAFQVKDDILDVEVDTLTLGKQQGADEHKHKSTYVSLLGLEGAKSKANTLYEEAMSALESLGQSAQMLRWLAEYIVKRNH